MGVTGPRLDSKCGPWARSYASVSGSGRARLAFDLEAFVEQLVAHLHLNPAKGYPRIFLDAAANITNTRLWWLAAFALLYAAIRWIEAFGLWLEKRWAEWFAVLSGAIYVPAELYELARGANALKLVLLVINICIVAYMIRALRSTRHDRSSARDPEAGV